MGYRFKMDPVEVLKGERSEVALRIAAAEWISDEMGPDDDELDME